MLADPANDPALLADAVRHYWVEYLDGGGFVALDASFPGADVGDAFTTAAASFAAAPAAERHTVQVALDVELMPLGLNGTFLRVGDALAQALGTPSAGFEHVGGLLVQTATVLDETLSAAELVGEPVSIGQFVNSRGTGGAGLSISVNTYSPWLQIGERDDLRRGTDFEETISTFASTLLTGMFLRTTVTSPDGTTTQQMREIVDRLGFAARRGEGAALALTLDGAPTLTEADVVTLEVNSGGYDLGEGAARHDRMASRQAALQTALATVPPAGPTAAQLPGLAAAGRDYMIAVTRLLAGAQVAGSYLRSTVLDEALGVRGYAATPRVTIAQARSRRIDGTVAAGLSLDLRKRDGRAVVAPGQWAAAAPVFETARGLADSHVEGLVLEGFGSSVPVSFERFAEAADAAGLTLRTITAPSLGDLDGLALSPEARARIRAAVEAGRVAIVPGGTGARRLEARHHVARERPGDGGDHLGGRGRRPRLADRVRGAREPRVPGRPPRLSRRARLREHGRRLQGRPGVGGAERPRGRGALQHCHGLVLREARDRGGREESVGERRIHRRQDVGHLDPRREFGREGAAARRSSRVWAPRGYRMSQSPA